ncbi:MAG: hypothetical protein ACOH2R_00520 [Pseudomonas sp.]
MQNMDTPDTLTSPQSKAAYENAIGLSQHVPQAKTISEMVLDAFDTAKESDTIRELRAEIRQANDAFDDDKAYELMGQLKQLKDAELASSAALEDLSSKFTIQQILASYKTDPAFEEIVFGLALKVLNHTHQAIKEPAGGKAKNPRPKKEAEVFVISKDEVSMTFPIRSPRSKPSADREAFEFLGFNFVGEGDEAELEVSTFLDKDGAEQPATRKSIVTAIQEQTAFEGYTVVQQ